MSVDATTEAIAQTEITAEWQPPMPPTDLIFDDGVPLETNRHRTAMNVLIRSLQQAWAHRQDFFTGGNMFVYYSSTQARNRDFRGPDFFAVLGIDGSYSREGWVVWNEEGRYPDVIVELMSDSTAEIDTGIKKDIYEQTFRTPDYFVFHPFNPNSLQGWHLDISHGYQPLEPNERGWLWCETLGFWLGTWEGTVERQPAIWLRFYDEAGNLVLLPEEAAAQQAEAAQQQAEAAQQQAEEQRQQAEEQRQQAEAAQQQAEAAQQQAEAQRQQAEAAQQQAEEQRQRAERLAARLRELGEDPNNL